MPGESDASVEAESTVSDSYGTTIPSEVRNALDEAVESGDTVRWMVSERTLSVEIIHERYGAFEDAESLDGLAWDSEAAAESTWSE